MFNTEFGIMIYVEDVEKEKEFWKSLGFVISNEQTILDYPSFDMKINPESNCKFTVYSLEFIRTYSPEVAENQPSLLFTSTDIETLYEKVKQVSPYVSELNELPFKNFNFSSATGQYYAVREA